MTERFTYVDFLMYVLPGVVLSWVILGAWMALDLPLPPLTGDAGVFGSVVFILMCFIAGHLVQAIAHEVPERVLKRLFWGGYYPSELMLFAGSRMLGSRERERYVKMFEEHGLLAPEIATAFSGMVTIRRFRCRHERLGDAEFKGAVDGAQLAFNRARVALEESGLGVRARRAEGYYQFYRGSYTAALLGLFIFGGLGLAPHFNLFRSITNKDVPILAASAVLCGIIAIAFGWRARGAGQGYAREVVRGYDYMRNLHKSNPRESATGSSDPS